MIVPLNKLRLCTMEELLEQLAMVTKDIDIIRDAYLRGADVEAKDLLARQKRIQAYMQSKCLR
jgi:hypothetical protein